jgi:hypothetical protein
MENDEYQMRINEMSHPTGDKRKGDVRYVPGYVSL